MNSAILQARSQPDHAVIMVNAHHARVKSASDESQDYDVQLPLDIAREVTCNCQAGHFRKMCRHVAKVLMLKGASDKLLLRHMGILLGSDQGGYHALEVAMAAAAAAADTATAAAESAAAEGSPAMTPPAAQEELHNEDGSPDEADPADAAPSAAGASQSQSIRSRGEAAYARLGASSKHWEDDSPNWRWLALVSDKATEELNRMVSTTTPMVLEKSNSCPTPLTNTDAPAENSLKRKKSWLENAAARKLASRATRAQPFLVQAAHRKPRSELEDIQTRNKQQGIVSTLAAMQRLSSAPQLPPISELALAARRATSRMASAAMPVAHAATATDEPSAATPVAKAATAADEPSDEPPLGSKTAVSTVQTQVGLASSSNLCYRGSAQATGHGSHTHSTAERSRRGFRALPSRFKDGA